MGGRVSEDSWHQARLISTSGIKSVDEQERRATSALLAVVGAVREFGRAVIQPLGAPTGELNTFVEVPFAGAGSDEKGSADGLIRVRHAQRTWTALVEVKTGAGRLDAARVQTYLDVAGEQRFDAVLTISNEIPAAPGQHPVAVDPRRLPNVGLYHYTWSHLLAEAVMQKEYRGVADPDQAWVLSELIRYLEHPRSGTIHPIGREVIDLTGSMEMNTMTTRETERGTMERGTVETATIASMTSISRSVSVEPALPAPRLPSRRDLRLARPLDTGSGKDSSVSAEAGWYQDPGDARRLRWYDGTAWSERTYPAQPALA
jgi:Protein of unknown function (DUF2510)